MGMSEYLQMSHNYSHRVKMMISAKVLGNVRLGWNASEERKFRIQNQSKLEVNGRKS